MKKFGKRLIALIRVELGHVLLGKIEEHRLGPCSATKYTGPTEALRIISREAKQKASNSYVERDYCVWEPAQILRKKWRKDSQLFLA